MTNAPLENPLPVASPLRILVVEDNLESAASMDLLLQMYGYQVQVAPNGPAAIEVAQTNELDVVLLDIGLPGMDGWVLAGHLSQLAYKKRPLFIAITGYGEQEARQRSAEAGIDLHLVKPVDPIVLESILGKFQRIVG